MVSPDFNAIKSTGAYDIEINEGEADGKISLIGDSSIIDKIIVEVNEQTLIIKQKPGFYTSHGDAVKISLNANKLKGLALTGSGSILTKGVQSSDEMNIVLDGSGNISTQISTEKANIQLNGSGDISLNGQVNDLVVNLSGSGDINAFGLIANHTNAGLTGSGNLEVYARNSLIAGVTGSGQLLYKGVPEKKEFKQVGSGEIHHIE